METVSGLGTSLRLIAVQLRVLLLGIAMAAVLFVAPASDENTVFASQIGTLDATPAFTEIGTTVTATVFDPDLNVTVLREFESTDNSSNPYELPLGTAGDTKVYKVTHTSIGDFNADGVVDDEDIQVSTTKATVQWVNKDAGTFQVGLTETVGGTESFTVTYRSEHKDTTTVTLRSPSDADGFTLTLEETTTTSHTFAATFKTGESTASTGASDPSSSTRPTLKVVDGDSITIEYADASPAKLISEAVVIDTTKPSVSITSPMHKGSTSNATAWARAVVTDSASGVELSQIKFHVDVDRDCVFDEPRETVTASATESSQINQGWNAMALLPAPASDGALNAYVTATDRASNIGRTDAEATTGDQNHTCTVDTSPPGLVEVVLGQSWDASDEKVVDNVLNSVKVKWAEDIKESSIEKSRFIIGSETAATATMIEDINDTVWLTFEDIPTSPERITILPGAVSDKTDFPSELKEIIPIDKLGPRLTVGTDRAITNGLLTITVSTVETITEDPTVTIDGVTFGSAKPIGINEWSIEVDGTTFTGSAAGDGVKNVEAAGFDAALNIARGGLAVEAAGYPTGAVQFDLDTVIKLPVVLPGDREVAKVSNPLITISYPDEIGEYAGDTHSGVTITKAILDGVDVTANFTSESSSTWTFRPVNLENGEHILEVAARDDAGNTHTPVVRVFTVDAPLPTPTPVPTESPTPAPVEPEVPAPTATPIATAEPSIPEVNPETTPEAVPTPESTAEPVVTPEVAPTPEPEQVVDPEPVADSEPTSESDPEAAPTPDGESGDAEEELTDEDIQATVTALRGGDEQVDAELTEDEVEATVQALRLQDDEDLSSGSFAPEPALTVFGCAVPTGDDPDVRAVIPGADYIIMAVGLVGLVAVRVRPKRRDDDG